MGTSNKIDLTQLAKQLMQEKGLEPEFSEEELWQLSSIKETAAWPSHYRDLRSFLWSSIDNDDSRDLDQLTYIEKNGDRTTLWIAIADVDSLVKKGTPIDKHAEINTTSIYTPAKIFSMLPEKLSTDLTSLNEGEDRSALVIQIEINTTGEVKNSSIFHAIVRNHAKLTYSAVGSWLEGIIATPKKILNTPGLETTLKKQHETAQILKNRRHAFGSLTLETSKPEAKVVDEEHINLEINPHNYAHQLIEEFMIAANYVIAQSFSKANIPALRRVVRIPKRWERIVELAREYGDILPIEPDAAALDRFLIARKQDSPETFPDLSLTIVKLLGKGEYVVENGESKPIGHFALALNNYTHSTAPNRRFPDLIAQRQYKAFLENTPPPYSLAELQFLANHCTQQEDAAQKVERHINKSAAAMLLIDHIGETFQGIITGADDKGTWVRIFQPPVEGKLVRGKKRFDVGDKVAVTLIGVDIAKGYIDFTPL